MQGEIDSLKKLHTTLIDAQKGYDEALADTKDASLIALFRDTITMRERHHAQIHRQLLQLNKKSDENGSFMASVHRAIISAEASLGGLENRSLSGFIDGESRILADYDDAIEAFEEENAPLSQLLLHQRGELDAKIADMNECRPMGTLQLSESEGGQRRHDSSREPRVQPDSMRMTSGGKR
jgi:uncharacterized protein (TIGR02284 family)